MESSEAQINWRSTAEHLKPEVVLLPDPMDRRVSLFAFLPDLDSEQLECRPGAVVCQNHLGL